MNTPVDNQISIRPTRRQELPDILTLVRELAIYEREPEAVTATLEDYYSAWDEGLIGSHVALFNNRIVGMTVYYMTFSTWKGKMLYLEDFYVDPQFRKLGLGQKLFDAFLHEAKTRGAKLTKWQVLDWNEPGLNFYKKNNAIIETNWWNGKIFLK